MNLKSFVQFINEYDASPLFSVNVAGQKTDLKNDLDLDKKIDKYVTKKEDFCPRCEERFEECKCQEEDHWSTQNYHRTAPGDKVENEPQQNFKKKK